MEIGKEKGKGTKKYLCPLPHVNIMYIKLIFQHGRDKNSTWI